MDDYAGSASSPNHIGAIQGVAAHPRNPFANCFVLQPALERSNLPTRVTQLAGRFATDSTCRTQYQSHVRARHDSCSWSMMAPVCGRLATN